MDVHSRPDTVPPVVSLLPAQSVRPLGCRTTVLVPGGLLTLSGRLDVRAAADVRMALVEAVNDGLGKLVLEVSGLTALDATGLGVLVGAHRRAQRAGRILVLRAPSPAVSRLLFLTRLDRVLRTEQGLTAV